MERTRAYLLLAGAILIGSLILSGGLALADELKPRKQAPLPIGGQAPLPIQRQAPQATPPESHMLKQPQGIPITVRSDPYKTFRFLVYFGSNTMPVAGVSKVTGLSQPSAPIASEKGRTSLIRKGRGRTEYGPITLEGGLTRDREFEKWASAAQALSKGASTQALRREVRIDLLNEAGQPVQRYFIHGCWVSQYQALPDLDAGGNTVALVHVKLENEGWERDLSLAEPAGQ